MVFFYTYKINICSLIEIFKNKVLNIHGTQLVVCNRVLTHSPILAVQDPVISLKIENYMYFKFLKNSLVQANNYKEWSIKGINTHFTKEQNPDITSSKQQMQIR